MPEKPKKPEMPRYDGTDLTERYLIVPSRWGYSIFDCKLNVMLRGFHTTRVVARRIIAEELDPNYIDKLIAYHRENLQSLAPQSAVI